MFADKIKNRTVEWLSFEFYKMLSRYHNIDGRYRETKEFKKLFKIAIYEILQNNENAAPIIHQCLLELVYTNKYGIFYYLLFGKIIGLLNVQNKKN